MSETNDASAPRHRRDLRGRIAVWLALAMAGAGSLALAYDGTRQSLMPGPITPAHRIVAKCESCHANIGKGSLDWVHATTKASNARADNALCLDCHKLGETPHRAHGLAKAVLNEKSRSKSEQPAGAAATGPATGTDPLAVAASAGSINAAFRADGSSHAEIACSICHTEHRHQDAVTHAADTAACNTCHQANATGFAEHHPELSRYPFRRRTRIKFDHVKHFTKNFDEARTKRPDLKAPPQTCTSCHELSPAGRDMTVKPFAETCSACHLPQIVGADRATGPKGIAFLALPGLDLETLRSRKAPVGSWPEDAEADIPPLMRVLLARDAERQNLLATVDKLDLFDLTSASDSDIESVTALAWEIKELVHELTTAKASKLLRRIHAATGGSIDRQEMTRLLGTLPRDVLISAQRHWLPDLGEEIALRAKPGWQKTILAKFKVRKLETAENESGPEPPKPPETKLVTNTKGGRWYVSVLGEIVQEGLEPPETRQAIKGEIEDPPAATAPQAAASPSIPPEAPQADVAAAEPAIDDETWSEFGGWYRKDHTILYRPSGHADALIKSWLDVSAKNTASHEPAIRRAIFKPAFETLSDREAQGRCMKCHSLEENEAGGISAMWNPSRVADKQNGFTTFKHQPHFSLLDNRGCMTCHELEGPADFKAAYGSFNPTAVAQSFKPIKKATCAKCHSPGGAPEDCGHCHTYHVTPITTPVSETRLPEPEQSKPLPAATEDPTRSDKP